MKTIRNPNGSVFITTIISTFLMTLMGAYAYQMATQDLHFVHRMEKAAQAHQLAEAGLARALSLIASVSGSNFTTAINTASNFPVTSLGPGTYDASTTTSGGRVLVSSTGTVDDVEQTVSAEVSVPSISTLDYAIAGGSSSAHTIDSGTGQSPGNITGNIYMGGPLTLDGPSSGGSLVITGSVTSLSTVTTNASATVSGTTTQNSTTSGTFPTVDFSYYQTIATTNSLYFNGNKTYSSGQIPAAPTGGVIFVNGNLTIQGTQSTTACIIATGNITFSKTGNTYPKTTVTKYSTYPALMTQNGSISYTSNGNGGAYLRVTGLIYSGNGFSVSSGNHDEITVTGNVIAKGVVSTAGMTAQNALTVTYASQSPPGFTTSNTTATIKSYNS